MNLYAYKNVESGSPLDVDTVSRRVKVAISRMGNLDHDKDIIDFGAYDKTIKLRGPQGSNQVWHLTDHQATLKSALGKFTELFVEGDLLVGVNPIVKTTWGNDVLEMYKSGAITEHSVGFKTLRDQMMNPGQSNEYRLIKEIQLYEGSAVLYGANDQTPTLSVGKSLTQEDRQKDLFDSLKEISNLVKVFKSGNLSDETYELIELSLTQKTARIKQLFADSTQPALSAVAPDKDEEWLSVLKTFNDSLITAKNDSSRTGSAT